MRRAQRNRRCCRSRDAGPFTSELTGVPHEAPRPAKRRTGANEQGRSRNFLSLSPRRRPRKFPKHPTGDTTARVAVGGAGGAAMNPLSSKPGVDGIEADEINAELRQCRALLPTEIDEIARRRTIPVTALTSFFLARVVFLDGDWFEFDRYVRDTTECVTAYVIPCRDHLGDLRDMAALSLDFNKVALWNRRVSVLGAENFFAPRIARILT